MTGKERALAAINLEPTDRIPQTEYCSNWQLIEAVTGIHPKDPELGHTAYAEFHRKLGFEFMWSTAGEPVPRAERGRMTDMGHAVFLEDGSDKRETLKLPFTTPEEVLAFDAVEEFGMYEDEDELVEFYEQAHLRRWEDTDDFYVPIGFYETLISACIAIFGWDMFLTAVGADPDGFDKVLQSILELNMQIYTAQAKTSAPCFLCHDDMVWSQGAIFHPDWYRKYIFPKYKQLWEPIKASGKKILFCSDGDFTEFVDDFVEAGVDAVIPEPMTDFEMICERYGGRIAIMGGKIDCRTLTFGTKEQIKAEVEASYAIGRKCPGFFMAVGNHIPSNVPLENGLYYLELCAELRQR